MQGPASGIRNLVSGDFNSRSLVFINVTLVFLPGSFRSKSFIFCFDFYGKYFSRIFMAALFRKKYFRFSSASKYFYCAALLISIITNIPTDTWTGGHGKGFIGFFGHQNLLASVLLFTLPAVFSKLWRPKNIEHQLPLKAYSLKLTAYYLPLTAYSLLLTAQLAVHNTHLLPCIYFCH